SEGSAGDRVMEFFALAKDGELLTDLAARALADIYIERASFLTDHEAFQGTERLDEVVDHEREGRSDPIGHPGGRAGGARERAQQQEAADRPGPHAQKVTEGLWIPNTPRRRSEISPGVTPTSTAATRSGRGEAEPVGGA